MPIKMIFRKNAVSLLLLLSIPWIAFSRESVDSLPVKIMFYNAENLFDTEDDSIKDDTEYLPGGLMRWNKSRYYN